ncbi:hypothetical protein LPJ64_004828 [Coemansia asiatica]|uniref:Uncharacterized protein n=1 Tax=Coemansia asiatica TaxID=1052880 RepID=A0A9W7XFI0_9FUNG|nr:hypothetical protein LPJ64_004828 [Coemansia asiatica]
MEVYFKQHVESQQFELHSMDMLSGFTNISYLYYFANCNKSKQFIKLELVRDSFFKALLDFPLLAGRISIDGKSGRASIVVDKGNLNMPEYAESKSVLSYEQLRNAGFGWNMLPSSLFSAGTVPRANKHGELKMAHVNVLELRDNSGIVLFVSIPHYAVDGVGYCAFMEHWSLLCRCLHEQKPVANNKIPKVFSFDRCTIDASLPENRSALDSLTHSLYADSSYLSQFMSWLSPEKRGTLLSTVSSLEAIEGHVFYLSARSLALLRENICKALANDNNNSSDSYSSNSVRLSDNDMITSLASIVVAQGATADLSPDNSFNSNNGKNRLLLAYQSVKQKIFSRLQNFVTPVDTSDHWTTSIVVDARCRLKQIAETKYTGNAVFVVPILRNLNDVHYQAIDKATASLAMAIRNMVSHIDGSKIAQVVDIVSQTPQSYMNSLANSILNSKKVVVSNQSRFPLYSVDFGFGCPEWISPIPAFYANFVSILPKSAELNGYHIYITTSKGTMQQILANKSWLEYACLVY